MIFHILKKDLLKRKGVNLILFVFITLATVFLSSSVNNIIVVGSAVDYYMDYAEVPDVNLITTSLKEKDQIDTWLKQEQKSGDIDRFDYDSLQVLSEKALTYKSNGKDKFVNTKGNSLYLGRNDLHNNRVFDMDGKPISLKAGEIALSPGFMENNHLKIGDKLQIKVGDLKKSLTIKESIKDASYGNDMVGMIRIIASDEDYDYFKSGFTEIGLFYIDTENVTMFKNDLTDNLFDTAMNVVTRDHYQLVYSFDMIMAALLIVIGVCLIAIALLVLRFTLVFTMEEQYQEIGILKAIGLRNRGIKKIYLMKYMLIVSAGAFLGLFVSFPVSTFMVESVSANMIMESSQANFAINSACALLVVVLVLAFCYLCTRKLNKFSAIDAIRNGQNGERYHKLKGLRLAKRLHMPIPLFLGIQDILSHMRRYAVLIITFCISFILITVPLNTLNTMKSTEMVEKFMMNPKSNVYVQQIELKNEAKYTNTLDLRNGMTRLKKEMQDKGYEKIKITAVPIYFIKFSNKGETAKNSIMSVQAIGDNTSYLTYSEGSEPKLENEIAISKSMMKERGWRVGDTINSRINGEDKAMVISGSFTDYMQMGQSARLNSLVNCDDEVMFDYWCMMVEFKTDMTQEEAAKALKKQFPNYVWSDGQTMIDRNVGGIQDALDTLLVPMTALLCGIIMLITLLMEKLFITREKSEIAIMKSIGFRNSAIRKWQLIRIICVVLTSMIISIPLSLVSNELTLKPIFAIMGADVTIQVNPLQAYLIYPGILLIGIIIATLIATYSIKKIEIHDMNNLE